MSLEKTINSGILSPTKKDPSWGFFTHEIGADGKDYRFEWLGYRTKHAAERELEEYLYELL